MILSVICMSADLISLSKKCDYTKGPSINYVVSREEGGDGSKIANFT